MHASSTKTLNATIPPRPVAMVYDPSQTAWTVAEERVLEEQLSLSSCAPSHELAIELRCAESCNAKPPASTMPFLSLPIFRFIRFPDLALIPVDTADVWKMDICA